MRLRQIAQRATDIDASVSFYRDVLGLELIARFDPPGLAFFDLDGTRLLLEAGAPAAILYFAVDDIDATYESLVAKGVAFEGPPHLIHRDDDGTFGPAGEEEHMAIFTDPAGNTLAIATRR
jgi:methylmalonyl-CoA/ethylmalonyl-CoA epimerase